MKKSIILTLLLGFLYVVLSSDIDGAAHHGHGNVTGATTGVVGHCQTSSCHGANNPLTIVALTVTDTSTMLPITVYNALQTYLITITGNDTAIATTLPGFGFQASAVLGNHTQAGTFVIPSASSGSLHTYPCGATTIVEHTVVLSPTAPGSNKYSVQFYWTAPPPASDSVSFFSLLNAVNGNSDNSGDYPNAAPRVTIYENPATATCGVPSGLSDSAITSTSAYLKWTTVAGAITYKIQYRPTDSIVWHTVTSGNNYATITGLTPSTTYEFGVQAVCSGSPGNFSATNDTLTTAAASSVSHTSIATGSFSVCPNPSSGDPLIAYTLVSAETVSIDICDITGRRVKQMANQEFQASGAHQYRLEISAPGLYMVRLVAGGNSYYSRFIRQ